MYIFFFFVVFCVFILFSGEWINMIIYYLIRIMLVYSVIVIGLNVKEKSEVLCLK